MGLSYQLMEVPAHLRLLLLFWVCTLALAVNDNEAVSEVDSVVVLPESQPNKGDLVSGGVVMADTGAKTGMGKDGCSGAYKKFKANVQKMTVLKTKAEKKKAKA